MSTQINQSQEERDALALVITNAYRNRHSMPPLESHAPVDEDIAEAILFAGWERPIESKSSSVSADNESAGIDATTQHDVAIATLLDTRKVIMQYLSTAEKWRYDRVAWAFAIMLGEIPEDSPEPEGTPCRSW